MIIITRRAALLGTGASMAALLAACGPTTSPITPAQVVADAQGIVAGLAKALGIVTAADPNLISPGQAAKDAAGLNVAQGVLATIAANLPSAAIGRTQLQTIEDYINAGLTDLSAVTPAVADLVPALRPAVPLIQAAVVLVPIFEAFINPPGAQVAALRAKALAPAVSIDQARRTLGVKVS